MLCHIQSVKYNCVFHNVPVTLRPSLHLIFIIHKTINGAKEHAARKEEEEEKNQF